LAEERSRRAGIQGITHRKEYEFMSIELEHSFAVPVPPEQAWDALLDVQRVAPCMPGATVDSVDGDEVTGTIKVKVGPIALTYVGQARFTERDDAARSVKIEGAGKETKGAGTATATVLARLTEENGHTRVSVHTTLNVTGRPAQFGRGVMADVSSRIIDKFAANLAGQLAAAGEPEAAALPNGQVPDSRMAIPIQELNLPARSFNSLKGEGIDTVGELVSRTAGELLSIRNLGHKSVGEIEQRLGDLGLALADGGDGRQEQGTAISNGSAAPAVGGVQAAAAGPAWDGSGSAGDEAERLPGDAAELLPGDEAERLPGDAAELLPGDEAERLPGDEAADDSLNLLDVAAGPILKRLLPGVVAVAALIWLGTRLRRRGRRSDAG
jgi:carbon monoxide dehydrogenase subunit G